MTSKIIKFPPAKRDLAADLRALEPTEPSFFLDFLEKSKSKSFAEALLAYELFRGLIATNQLMSEHEERHSNFPPDFIQIADDHRDHLVHAADDIALGFLGTEDALSQSNIELQYFELCDANSDWNTCEHNVQRFQQLLSLLKTGCKVDHAWDDTLEAVLSTSLAGVVVRQMMRAI